jgi:hypothetical protein
MRDRARSSISGRKANAAGNAFEAMLDAQHEAARRCGIIVRVDKTDPPAVVRKGRVEFGERTGADYVGMLGRGMLGQTTRLESLPRTVAAGYFCVEAKSTLKEYQPKNGDNGIKELQQEHLNEVAVGGGLALLAVQFRGMPEKAVKEVISLDAVLSYRAYCCPWLLVPWQVLKTAESVSELDLLRDGWAMQGDCYLERFHPRGVPTSAARGRVYPRE